MKQFSINRINVYQKDCFLNHTLPFHHQAAENKTVKTNSTLQSIKKEIASLGHSNFPSIIAEIISARTYYIGGNYSQATTEAMTKSLLRNPVLEDYYLNRHPSFNFDYAIEICFKMGVTDNLAQSIMITLRDFLKKDFEPSTDIKTARLFFIRGKATKIQLEKIAKLLWYNPLIEEIQILSYKEWKNFQKKPQDFKRQAKNKINIPLHNHDKKSFYEAINLEVADVDLEKISKERHLSLSLEEMQTIKKYFVNTNIIRLREKYGLPSTPTDLELEVLAQTWSEHCKHKIFAANITYSDNGKQEKITSLYATYIKSINQKLKRKRAGFVIDVHG